MGCADSETVVPLRKLFKFNKYHVHNLYQALEGRYYFIPMVCMESTWNKTVTPRGWLFKFSENLINYS